MRQRGDTSELSPPLRGEFAGALYPPTPLILSCSWAPYPVTPAFSPGEKSPYVESHWHVWKDAEA